MLFTVLKCNVMILATMPSFQILVKKKYDDFLQTFNKLLLKIHYLLEIVRFSGSLFNIENNFYLATNSLENLYDLNCNVL
jgi:hypothetical protein